MEYTIKTFPDYLPKIEERLNELKAKYQSFTFTLTVVDLVKLDMTVKIELDHRIGWNGYAFTAIVEKIADGENMVHLAAEIQDWKKWATTELRCDHCHTNRNRKMAFIFVRESDGAELMIAKSCSREYFGEDIYSVLKDFIRACAEISAMEDDEYFGGRFHEQINLRGLAALAYGHMASTKRFVSQSKADYEMTASTTAIIGRLMNPSVLDPEYVRLIEEANACTQRARDDGFCWTVVADYWTVRETETLFENNVRLAWLSANPKIGMIIWSVWAWMAAEDGLDIQHKAEMRKAKEASQHVSAVGERIETDVSVTVITAIDGHYGTTYMVKMIDENNNILVWFASSYVPSEIEPGAKVRIKGTIKKHDEYRGAKQTVLTRCKVVA